MAEYTPRTLAGRYEVGDLIGRGGMAEVHVGRDKRLGRTVAIKMLRSDLARDPAFQARFRREAQAAASLNHPDIVAVYDTGEDVSTAGAGQTARSPFIIMEYVEGHTLRELMRDGAALPINEAIDITIGVLSALQYAHHAGIVHRDIKPANIMLTAAGQVKVMDFGIARALADTAATMTQTQAVIGTAQYLSPEQARGETVDARSDLYSTGCVLYELLTGRPPFVGDSAVAVAYQHVRELPVAPSSLAPDVPEVLDRIVLKALEKDRELRYTTASEFRADLEVAKRGGQVSARAQVPPGLQDAGRTQVLAPAGLAQAMAQAAPGGPQPPVPGPSFATSGVLGPPGAEEEDAEELERAKKRKRWTIIGIVAGVVLLFAVIAAVLALRGDNPTPGAEETPSSSPTPSVEAVTDVTVPQVRPGMTPAQAEEELTALDLVPVQIPTPDMEVEEGAVIGFIPVSGELAPPGSQVQILVSTGPEMVEVPATSGMEQETAREVLRSSGLRDGSTAQASSPRIAEGLVVRTEPAAGESIAAGTEVKIFLSTGKTAVPDLVGLDVDEAITKLQDAGLTAGTTVEELSDLPAGQVLKQSVKAKKKVAQRTQVTLTVSREAQTVRVPEVTELAKAVAEQEIKKLGLLVEFQNETSDFVAAGFVTRTNPAAGKKAREGDTVLVYVSAGPAPVATSPAAGDPNSPNANGLVFPPSP
ncbi:MAG: Stk1 family PASTA domain-containing Ser/Thr kinase [Bifidobacteriaceae bacterium]|nr:Stk1 family PASTA domain-containing Ser/Thr kinase [Bifidobacteriaceae bacterium]